MENASAFEQVIIRALAIAAPLYSLDSLRKGAVTIRLADGARTSYTRQRNARGFWVSIGFLGTGAGLAWSVILGFFDLSGG